MMRDVRRPRKRVVGWVEGGSAGMAAARGLRQE